MITANTSMPTLVNFWFTWHVFHRLRPSHCWHSYSTKCLVLNHSYHSLHILLYKNTCKKCKIWPILFGQSHKHETSLNPVHRSWGAESAGGNRSLALVVCAFGNTKPNTFALNSFPSPLAIMGASSLMAHRTEPPAPNFETGEAFLRRHTGSHGWNWCLCFKNTAPKERWIPPDELHII